MTERAPLVVKDGRVQELPRGDTARGADPGEPLLKRGGPLPLELTDDLRFHLECTGLFL